MENKPTNTPILSAEETVKKHFVPGVCSEEYFNMCLREKDSYIFAPTQAIKALEEHAQPLQERLNILEYRNKNQADNIRRRIEDELKASDKIYALEERIKELEQNLSKERDANHWSENSMGNAINDWREQNESLKSQLKAKKEECENFKSQLKNLLPKNCVMSYGEVKYCPNRQGDGNKCKQCMD